MSRVLLLLIFLLTASVSFAENVITIDSGCVRLKNIFPNVSEDADIFCGLDYGQTKSINRQMSLYIINKYNIQGARPGEATFRRSGVLLTKDRLQDDIRSLLDIMYSDTEVEIGNIRMSRNFYISPDMNYDIKIPQNRFGNVSISVDNGIRKFNYTVNLKAYKEVYVASSTIKKGEGVKGKISLRRMDMSRIRGEVITNPENLIASRNISQDRPVLLSQVVQRPDALKGSAVVIVYRSNGLNLSTTGELVEDAYIGKNVRVRNSTSGKIVLGKFSRNRKVIINN